jgi:hypothetical protein
MDEGKTIPIRRSRAGASGDGGGVRATIAEGFRRIADPPRQVWLAGLGAAAMTARGAVAAWARMVSEGAEVESDLRRVLTNRTTDAPSSCRGWQSQRACLARR